MTNIEKIKGMILNGEISEDEIPVGTLKHEGRARMFLRKWAERTLPTEEEIGYERICALYRIIEGDSLRMARKGEGHVGDFLDALAGNTEEEKEDPTHAEYMRSVWKEFAELGERYYSYVRCVGNVEILSLVTSVIGYVPIC